MRILIVDCAYAGFLLDFYHRQADVQELDFERHRRRFMGEGFGTADAMSVNLRLLGHEAEEVVVNAVPMQAAWAREHGVSTAEGVPNWHPEILAEQVRVIRPDLLYVQEISPVRDEFWSQVRPHVRLLVGQVACTIPAGRDFSAYDLIVSSWRPLIDHFLRQGRSAEYLPLGFDHRVLDRLGTVGRQWGVSFVGGLGAVHPERTRLIEHLCRNVELDVWGYHMGDDPLPETTATRHRGSAWGLDMYRILAGSRITINQHGLIEVAGRSDDRYANNQRLFEATGVGTLLITDPKENLAELFAPGQEVVTYRDPDDCVEQVQHLLKDETRRRAIAEAGQQRTLREHTYAQRMEQLANLLAKHMP